jgi:hypothetical protein
MHSALHIAGTGCALPEKQAVVLLDVRAGCSTSPGLETALAEPPPEREKGRRSALGRSRPPATDSAAAFRPR